MVFHNAAHAKENRKTFQSLKFVQEAGKFVDSKHVHGVEAGMIAVLAMSYVYLPAEMTKLRIEDELSKHIVATLNKTISAPDHTYNQWNTRKLVSGIANIATLRQNASALIHQDILDQILKVLNFDDAYDKESALNAIWSLINEHTSISVFATDGLIPKLEQLSKAADASVKQAALRVLAKAKSRQAIGE